MTTTPQPEQPTDDEIPEDAEREHAQDPAEGADPDDAERADVPDEHAEGPSEG